MQATVERLTLKYPNLPRIVSSIAWLSVDRLRLLVMLGLGAWMARYFGPDQFGLLNYTMAVIYMVAVGSDLGLEILVVRELIRRPEEEARLLGTAFWIRLAAGSLLFVILFIGTAFYVKGSTEKWLFWIFGVLLFNQAFLSARFWFQAHLYTRRLVLIQTFVFLICAAARLGMLIFRRPLLEFAALTVFEQLLVSVTLLVVYQRQNLRPIWQQFDLLIAKKLLGESWPLILSGLAVMIYMRIDQIMLEHMLGSHEVGIYSAAVKISEVWYFIPTILANSLFPTIVRSRNLAREVYFTRMQQFFSLNALLAYALILPVVFLASHVIRILYGSGYDAAAPVLAIHIWSSLFVFLGTAREQFLVNEGYVRFSLVTTALGAALNIALNLWLIPLMASLGAALATLISYALAAVIMSLFYEPTRAIGLMQLRALVMPFSGLRALLSSKA